MKKCRIRTKTTVLAVEPAHGGGATARIKVTHAVAMPQQVTLAVGTVLDFVGTDDNGDVRAINPLDPERIITIARDAVEMYNEGLRIWQTLRAFFASVVGFFKGIFVKKKPTVDNNNTEQENRQ